MENKNILKKQEFAIYHGLIKSKLFDAKERFLIMYLIGISENDEEEIIDLVNIAKITINKLCKDINVSKGTLCQKIKLLEEKGVLIKEFNMIGDKRHDVNTYKILNFASVWDCKTLEELKNETDRIKREVLLNGK